MPMFELQIGSETYTGKTQKAATQAAFDRLARLFPEHEVRHGWDPIVIRAPREGDHLRPNVGVVYKQADGAWAYQIDWAADGKGSPHEGGWDRFTAENRCRQHLAQAAYKYGVMSGLEVIADADENGKVQHLSWVRFQDAYASARAEGLTDEAARQRGFNAGHQVTP